MPIISNSPKDLEETYRKMIINYHLTSLESTDQVIKDGFNIINNLHKFYKKDSEDYKNMKKYVENRMDIAGENKIANTEILIKLEKPVIVINGVYINSKTQKNIFENLGINTSYKDKNINYLNYKQNIKEDSKIIYNNIKEHFKKYGTFNNLTNNIASKGTNNFKYNQMDNGKYKEFYSLIDNIYSSNEFESVKENFYKLKNLINNDDYCSKMNKDIFGLVEKDFKKLEEFFIKF